jgi:peptide/nickel transport system ATP-binding protein
LSWGKKIIKNEALINVENLRRLFPVRRGFISSVFHPAEKIFVRAVGGVSFQIDQGKVLGLAGESGSGKTTTGKLLALLDTPTDGRIVFRGRDITRLNKRELKSFRKKVQMIFQDPYESLDPRFNVYDIVCEPLYAHHIGSSKEDRTDMVYKMLEDVELKPPEEFHGRYPHELSGGQRQRVAIARALVLNPEVLVADEPVSMLDVSIRSGIMNLMLKLKEKFRVTYLFITHDLSVARYMCDNIAIMYLGKIVEIGPTEKVISNPLQPYTRILLSNVPIPDPTFKRKRIRVHGEVPSGIDLPEGCPFHPRCPYAQDMCRKDEPQLFEMEKGHFTACHLEFG